jgi:ribosomal 50S subunit-associated protein YjgA (DUF615 family)
MSASFTPSIDTVPNHLVTRHRFVQVINGRSYQIDVALVAADRWRAQLVRQYGGPSALMPFYGQTPDEAADQLSQWLARANKQAAASI